MIESTNTSPAPAEKRRLFVALAIPETARASLAAWQRTVAETLRRPIVKWLDSGQIHLTLLFLGNVPEADLESVKAALRSGVSVPGIKPFCLGLAVPGCFPDLRSPRVVWAGVQGDLDVLATLHAGVSEALAPFVEREEARPFQPHVTLGRVRNANVGDPRALKAAFECARLETAERWLVNEVELIQSRLDSDGARHETIATFLIAGAR